VNILPVPQVLFFDVIELGLWWSFFAIKASDQKMTNPMNAQMEMVRSEGSIAQDRLSLREFDE
jgi:hypothetical protein